MHRHLIAALPLLLAPFAHAAVAPPATPAQWAQAARSDIQTAYQLTLDHHPGTYDPANPRFAGNLARAKEQGLVLAAQVADAAGYVAALQRFNTLIHDGHAGVVVTLPGEWLAWRWPGFVAAWRGDALYVYAARAMPGSAAPPVGARIDACDGTPIAQLVERNVFAYTGRSEERGNWWSEARDVFTDKGNPFVTLPKECSFSLAGQHTTQALAWQPITDEMARWRTDSYNGDALPVGLSEPRAHLYWMAMPTFQPDEAQRDAYRTVYREVREHRPRYLDADALVIDLRHNQGGSSEWSQ
jgi:hypothetical protein